MCIRYWKSKQTITYLRQCANVYCVWLLCKLWSNENNIIMTYNHDRAQFLPRFDVLSSVQPKNKAIVTIHLFCAIMDQRANPNTGTVLQVRLNALAKLVDLLRGSFLYIKQNAERDRSLRWSRAVHDTGTSNRGVVDCCNFIGGSISHRSGREANILNDPSISKARSGYAFCTTNRDSISFELLRVLEKKKRNVAQWIREKYSEECDYFFEKLHCCIENTYQYHRAYEQQSTIHPREPLPPMFQRRKQKKLQRYWRRARSAKDLQFFF